MNKDKKNFEGLVLAEGYKQIAENAEEYIFIKDKNLKYLTASKPFLNLVGLKSTEEIVGKTDYDIFPPDIADHYRKDDEAIFAALTPIVGKVEIIATSEKSKRYAKTSKGPLFNEKGELIGLYGISHDFTEVVCLEEKAQTAAKFIDLVDKMPGGVGILHFDGDSLFLDYANEGWFSIHHLPFETALPSRRNLLSLVYQPDQEAIRKAAELFKGEKNKTGTFMYRVLSRDQMLHWISVSFHYAYSEEQTDFYYAAYTDQDDLMEAEERLRISESALKESINGSNVQYFTYFPGKRLVKIYALNNRYSDLPTTMDNFPEDFLKYIKASPSDIKVYMEMVEAINRGAKEASCTIQMFYHGAYYWENVHMTSVKDEKGNIDKVLGFTLDVTEKKANEDKLRKERVRLKTLEGNVFEAFSFNLTKNTMPDIQTSDEQMLRLKLTEENLTEAINICPGLKVTNPATREVLLRAAARIPSKEDRRLFISNCAGEQVRKSLREGKYVSELRYRRYVKDKLHWVMTHTEVLPDPDSGDFFAFFYTEDINEQVINDKINSQIISRNYLSVSYLDLQSNTFHWSMGVDGEVKKLNEMTYQKALKQAQEHVIPEEQEDFLNNFQVDTIKKALAKGPVYTIYNSRPEIDTRYSDKPHKQMKNDLFYLDDNKDVIVFLLSDVTEIFEAERDNREKLKEALTAAEQASVAKTEFLSRMSHEIRTPMNAIIGLDAIALQEKNLSRTMEDHLQKIGISARFLLSLINDILDMSRIESGRMVLKKESFNFEELINGINTILYQQCNESGLDYDCVIKSLTDENYVGDMTKLQQVLVNILGNAVKFTPSGGKIHFMVQELSRSKSQVNMRFEIADTGIGIDEKFLPHLFQPFSQENRGRTSAYGGTGLGLAISKNIVSLMGGDIKVHSIKNVGSEFTVDVALGIDKTRSPIHWSGLNMAPLFTLIVDDDIIVCQHSQLVLNQAGFKAEFVDSGNGALEKVDFQHKAKKDYDLILLDWKMPDMDGVETAARIRKVVGPDVTIIIMTAYDWTDIEAKALAAGVDFFMKKPIFASSVTRAFENVFYKKNKNKPIPEEKKKTFNFQGFRILVAEDNEINAEITKTLLTAKHCRVELAHNGAEAVEAFLTSKDDYFDLILMDVRMPIMDGLEATKTIRAMRKKGSKDIPIIAMTANAFQEDINLSLASGMNAHLAKPIEPEILYETIEKYLQKKVD